MWNNNNNKLKVLIMIIKTEITMSKLSKMGKIETEIWGDINILALATWFIWR